MTNDTNQSPSKSASKSSDKSSDKSADKSPDKSSDKSSGKSAEARQLEASFSTLILSVGSSAAMALGLGPNPVTNKVEKDLHLARFNIDLLLMLRDKTKGNLSADEDKFLNSLINDLQMKYIQS